MLGLHVLLGQLGQTRRRVGQVLLRGGIGLEGRKNTFKLKGALKRKKKPYLNFVERLRQLGLVVGVPERVLPVLGDPVPQAARVEGVGALAADAVLAATNEVRGEGELSPGEAFNFMYYSLRPLRPVSIIYFRTLYLSSDLLLDL